MTFERGVKLDVEMMIETSVELFIQRFGDREQTLLIFLRQKFQITEDI